MEAAAILAGCRREVEAALRSLLSRDDPPALYRMARYHLGWEDADGRPLTNAGGKALRPALCLLACEAVGGERQKAMPAAAAIELVHNFSLIHDDIQDADRERRHRPTVWSVWGEGQAINAGDALLALARIALLGLAERGLAAASVVEAGRRLDEATLEMVEGQVMDLAMEGGSEVELPEYHRMVEKKTGALFGVALRLGALVGGGDRDVIEGMGRAGRLLGVAYQIRDDVLGVWGEEGRTGKLPAADVRRRKKSLPIVYALSRAEGAAREELLRLYGAELGEEDVSRVLARLAALDARAYCRRAAEERKAEALAALDGLKLGSAAELRGVVDYLLGGTV